MRRSVILVAVILVAEVSSALVFAQPSVDTLLEQADAALARKHYTQAAILYQDALRRVADAPDISAAARIQRGLAVADLEIIRRTVATAASIAGNDMAALEELHRLHLRLRTLGGDAVVEQEIARAMNIRASLLIDSHEQTEAMTDVAPVLAIARYPQLSDSPRKRLASLAAKPWRILNNRAQSSDPLVAATFAGLAARVSGAEVPSRLDLQDKALFEFRRGSTVTVTAAPGCEDVASAVTMLTQRGAVQVDSTVAVDSCRVLGSRTEIREEPESYVEQVPYEATESYQEQVCYEVQVPVQVCTAIYTVTCVASNQSVSRYECSMAPRTRVVTRYRAEQRTRLVKRTYEHVSYGANLTWTRTYAGAQTSSTQAVSTTLVNGGGQTLGGAAAAMVSASLEEPVAAFVAERVAALRAEATAAREAGDLDRAESALLRLLLLGKPDDDYFQQVYFVDAATVRAALEPRLASAPAFAMIEVVPLPAITDERSDVVAVIRDRLAAQFPPMMARVQGSWFHADFGVISVPVVDVEGQRVGGGTAPSFGMYLGSPILSRLHGRTEGLGYWDDLRAGFDFGYTASKPQSNDRGLVVQLSGAYTGAIGLRLPWLQVLAGARVSAGALAHGANFPQIGESVGGTRGVSATSSYYGNLGIRLGAFSLTVEAWRQMPIGLRTRGATAWFTRRAGQADREAVMKRSGDQRAVNNNYLGVRVEEAYYRGCAVAPGDCVSTNQLRAWTAMFVLGFSVGK